MIIGEARRGAIVKHYAIFAQHQAVTGFANCECGESVAIYFIEECASVFALDVDLTQCRYIAKAYTSTRGFDLA